MATLVAGSAFDIRAIKTGKNPTITSNQDPFSSTLQFPHKIAHQISVKPGRPSDTDPDAASEADSATPWVFNWSATIKGKPYFSITDINLETLLPKIAEANVDFSLVALPGKSSTIGATRLMSLSLHANDHILGSRAKDWLAGFDGDDTLNGGQRNDVLEGGAGADVFQFTHYGSRDADTIRDFNAGIDKIQLDRSIFNKLPVALTDDMLVVKAKPKALDANDWLLLDAAHGKLYYDADANGKGKPQLIAKLTGVHDLDAADFIVLDQVI